jgi:hypothetical protein
MTGGFGGSMGGLSESRGKRPINVKFEIPYFTTSGIQVRYLKIIEPKLQYPSLPWVRYITQSGGMLLPFPLHWSFKCPRQKGAVEVECEISMLIVLRVQILRSACLRRRTRDLVFGESALAVVGSESNCNKDCANPGSLFVLLGLS